MIMKSPEYYEFYVKIADWFEYRCIWNEPIDEFRKLDIYDEQNWMIYREDAFLFHLKIFDTDLARQLNETFGLEYMIFPRGNRLLVAFYIRKNRPDTTDKKQTNLQQKQTEENRTDSNRLKQTKKAKKSKFGISEDWGVCMC